MGQPCPAATENQERRLSCRAKKGIEGEIKWRDPDQSKQHLLLK